ncbi:MAG TPA: lipoyl(octanoyl) transferase LipB [Kofleriaceae bacterium]
MRVDWLGRADYRETLAEQLARRERVWAGAEGSVILCEHPPVITLGRSATPDNILAAGDVPVERIERGGQVTYHGPGQLMIYPIVRVRGVVEFLERVAGAITAIARDFGIDGAAWRREPAGVWIGDAKLAACGIHISRGVSVHGWAFNIATPAAEWARIRPCGLSVPQISLAEARGAAVTVADVAALAAPRLVEALA